MLLLKIGLEQGMAVELQEIVDRLGHLLQRSVAVDDPNLQIIAYSHHYGDEDSARLQALVRRGAAENMVNYLASHRIHTWREPRYMDADESLGLKQRLVIPLWAGTTLVGFIWIIVEGELSPQEFDLALADVQEITGILALQSDKQQAAFVHKTRKVRELLQGSMENRQIAAEFFEAERDFAVVHSFNVLFIQQHNVSMNAVLASRDVAHEGIRRALSGRVVDAYALAELGVGTAVIMGFRVARGTKDIQELCQRVQREILVHANSLSAYVIGAGAAVSSLACAHESFAQAEIAARAAHSAGQNTLTWDQMGSTALLPTLVDHVPEPFLIPEQFRRMLSEQTPEMLKLLEVYLECAGSAADTAQRLHLHRSSVYYNVGQFQKSTGWDLSDGNSRFYLHLWLKTRESF